MHHRPSLQTLAPLIQGEVIMNNENDVAATIIALERAALDRWGKGDPSGYLEISAPEVVYFDPFLERRLHGLEALTRYYDTLRGKIRIDRDELINPKYRCVVMRLFSLLTLFRMLEKQKCAGIAPRFFSVREAVGASSRPTGQSLSI